MSTQQYDETTGLPLEPFDPRTGEYLETSEDDPGEEIDDQPEPDEGEEGVDWVWDLHSCRPANPHQGYGHAATACIEDRFGRLWLIDHSGRRQTQAKFCPFCGFQSLDDTAPDKPMQIVASDVALTPADRPQRVWVQNSARVMMRHFQFGSVRVLASDGCHAKVITDERVQLTVCVENLEQIKGERCLPKLGEKKEPKEKRDRRAVDPDLMKKYMNMGSD